MKYIISPEGQARLATSSCYWGMPANAAAGEHLTPEQKAALRWDQQPDYLARAQLYPAPDAELDAAMQDLWLEDAPAVSPAAPSGCARRVSSRRRSSGRSRSSCCPSPSWRR